MESFGKVIVLMGISGAGKDTWIKETFLDLDKFVIVYSADHWFMVEDKETGEMVYKFDVTELSNAHANCLRCYVEALYKARYEDDPRYKGQTLIVNNTNTSLAEVSPYCALALAHGFELEVVALVCPPEKAVIRNVHGTPEKNIFQQDKRLRKTLDELPPWWPRKLILTNIDRPSV